MARPLIEPITDANLAEVGAFLHQHLNAAMSAAEWHARLRPPWPGQTGNHGFAVRDDGRLVGVIGALYAERGIAGQRRRTCNITSWCVLDSHRQQSMRLAMAVVSQPGLHFTDLSPTKVVGGTLKFFKFQPLDERQRLMLNLPWPGGPHVLEAPQAIAAALQGDALQAYLDHRDFPWLRHLAIGEPGRWQHVIYKPRTYKHLPCAELLHPGEQRLSQAVLRRLGRHLLARGHVFTQVEARWLDKPPLASVLRTGFNQKLFLSSELAAEQIDYLYSETMAMDL